VLSENGPREPSREARRLRFYWTEPPPPRRDGDLIAAAGLGPSVKRAGRFGIGGDFGSAGGLSLVVEAISGACRAKIPRDAHNTLATWHLTPV
jgi:hypothetical protein